jgi:hypothetical protein
MTESIIAEQVRINTICRQYGIKFIAADVRGIAACCFTDFGDQFHVSDTTGEIPATNIITSISKVFPSLLHSLQSCWFLKFT